MNASAERRATALLKFFRSRRWLHGTWECACCSEQTDSVDAETGACGPCLADGASARSPRCCAACASGGRTWTRLRAGERPPVGAALRTHGDGQIEWSQPVAMLKEDEA